MLITVVDISDSAGESTYARRKLLSKEKLLTMSSAQEMVTKVLVCSLGKKITRLSIIDHGSPRHVSFGNNRFHLSKCYVWWNHLHRLRGKFHDYGYVHLLHCKAGQNRILIGKLAAIWEVPVVAHTGSYYTDDSMDGEYVLAYPGGGFESDIGKPTIWSHMHKMIERENDRVF